MAKPSKKYRIRDPLVRAISFVPRGANQESHVLLAKIDHKEKHPGFFAKFRARFATIWKDGEAALASETPPTTSEIVAERTWWNGWYALRDAFESACMRILDSDSTDKMALLRRSAEEFVAELEKLSQGASPLAMELVDATLASLGTTDDGVAKEAVTLDDIRKTLDLVEEEAHAPGRQTDQGDGEPTMLTREAVMKKVAAGEKLTADEAKFLETELAKTAPPAAAAQGPDASALKKQLDDERAEREKLAKRLEEEEAGRKKDKEVALEKELKAEVKGYTVFGLSDDERVTLLKGAPTPEYAALLRKNFAASTEASKRGDLFKEHGAGGTAPGSAAEKVNTLANELRKQNPQLSMPQARAKLYETEEGKLLMQQVMLEQAASH